MDNANEADAREMLIRRNLIGGFILLAISVLFMIEVRRQQQTDYVLRVATNLMCTLTLSSNPPGFVYIKLVRRLHFRLEFTALK